MGATSTRATAEKAREALGDFAPSLSLLAESERRRAEALVALAFELQRASAEELSFRAAEIRRTLAGEIAAPDATARALARCHLRRRFRTETLEDLAAALRARSAVQAATQEDLEASTLGLVRALVVAWLGETTGEIEDLGSALVRLAALVRLGPDLAAGTCPLAADQAGPIERPGRPPAKLPSALAAECTRLRSILLKAPRALVELPEGTRRAAAFAVFVAIRLLSRIEEGDASLLAEPPRVGRLASWRLWARARWLGV